MREVVLEIPPRLRIEGKSDNEAWAIWIFVALVGVAIIALLVALGSGYSTPRF